MTDVQQRNAAKEFAAHWKGKGYEKGESQLFWTTLLTDVFGVSNVADFIKFEDQVHLDHTSFIDGYILPTQKSSIYWYFVEKNNTNIFGVRRCF